MKANDYFFRERKKVINPPPDRKRNPVNNTPNKPVELTPSNIPGVGGMDVGELVAVQVGKGVRVGGKGV